MDTKPRLKKINNNKLSGLEHCRIARSIQGNKNNPYALPLFPNISAKFKRNHVVYKIPCAHCDWCYVGETGRCFETRKKEHMRNVRTYASGSNIAKHAWTFGHRIDFDNSHVIDKSSSPFRIRKTTLADHGTLLLSSMQTIISSLPSQYYILIKK